MFVRLIVSILVPAFVTSLAWAENASSAPEGGNYAVRSDVAEYVRTVTSEHGFKADELKALLSAVEYRADIIERISKPAEKVWTWARYKRHLVDEQRIAEGAVFWHKHADTIARAAQTFSVAPEIIVAILGIETRYGRITGTYPVLESLMTLGFDYPPRASFFRKELTEFLLLAREEDKDPTTLTGSYAGAMGYGQFISSSYRYYAVDFDDDGVRDIWANPVDAIGSIAKLLPSSPLARRSYAGSAGWPRTTTRARISGQRTRADPDGGRLCEARCWRWQPSGGFACKTV